MLKLSKKDIINLLPHREPMLLIDELSDIEKLETELRTTYELNPALMIG